MNILIAGGAGFIGSHLTDSLLNMGNTVICIDKLIMGDQNIKHLEKNKKFRLYSQDLTDSTTLNKVFEENSVDIVYHLAANSDIQKGGREPEIDFHDTFLTTRVLLEAMRRYNVKKLFFASTSAIYGEIPDRKLTEIIGGLMPVSYYGGAKLASEAFISSYVSMCDMRAVIFRFPNVIGPRLTHGVIYDFIKKLQQNPEILKILGDGTQCKPYLYVMDLIKAILQRTEHWEKGEQIYNLSVNGDGTTVTRIAEIVVEEMKLKNVKFCYTGGDRGWKGDVPRFQYDITKILSTGWSPQYTSEEAVRMSVRDAVKGVVL